jgi:hypothetical protein
MRGLRDSESALVRQRFQGRLQLAAALRRHDPALQQQPPQAIDQRRLLRHQTLPRPMQRLNVRLAFALHRHQPHGRPPRRLGDRLGVEIVVLARLHIGANALRRRQPRFVAPRRKNPPQMASPTTGFLRRDAAPTPADEIRRRLAPQSAPPNNPPRRIQARQAARVLAKVNPDNHDVHRFAPLSNPTAILTRSPREGRAIP